MDLCELSQTCSQGCNNVYNNDKIIKTKMLTNMEKYEIKYLDWFSFVDAWTGIFKYWSSFQVVFYNVYNVKMCM